MGWRYVGAGIGLGARIGVVPEIFHSRCRSCTSGPAPQPDPRRPGDSRFTDDGLPLPAAALPNVRSTTHVGPVAPGVVWGLLCRSGVKDPQPMTPTTDNARGTLL